MAIVWCMCTLAMGAAQYPNPESSLIQQTISIHPQITTIQPSPIETYLTPYDNAEDRFLQFLDQAKSKCYVASYSITNPNVVNKLIELHDRGVDVRILTDKTQAAGKRERAALEALTDTHIPVFAGRSIDNALMHCKFCVIDDHLVEDGSWNFTSSANREDNILNFVDSKPRAAKFLKYWLTIRKDMKHEQ